MNNKAFTPVYIHKACQAKTYDLQGVANNSSPKIRTNGPAGVRILDCFGPFWTKIK